MAKTKNDMVVKSNKLITASYYLTLNEIRLLDLALADLTSYEECEKHLTTMRDFVEIRAEEYALLYGIDKKKAYTQMQEASKQLFRRYFTYRIVSEQYPSHFEEREARWVQEIGYVEGKGIVNLSFTKVLIELAGKLKGSFGRYHLEQKALLTSVYAHRLYEMMMQWRGTNTVPYVGYHELRDRFNLDSKKYKTMSNFKRVVLDAAVNQINELTDIKVSYQQVKEGKEIKGFTFKFKTKETKKQIIKDANKSDTTTNEVKDSTKTTRRKIPNMTDSQRNTFANKLLKDFEFIRDNSALTIGKSREELLPWVESGLADDDKRQEWRKYILMSGYEFPDNLKR